MNPSILFATISMALAMPAASAATELEILRTRCTEQERQIRSLEEQIQTLKSGNGTRTIAVQDSGSAATYSVRPGDSLEKIARSQGCSPAKLAKINGLKTSSVIHPGQKLKLPGTAPAQATSPATASPAASSNESHKIREGETFSSISRQYGISVQSLVAANPKIKPTALRVGQVIRLSSGKPGAKPISQLNQPASRTTPVSAPPNPSAAPRKNADNPPATPPQQESPSRNPEKKVRSITIEDEMTYAEFAAKYGTDVGRLNDLNGLDLTNATVLAKGSELYVPAQP